MYPTGFAAESLVVADPDFERLVQQFAEREKRTDAENGVNWVRSVTVGFSRSGQRRSWPGHSVHSPSRVPMPSTGAGS